MEIYKFEFGSFLNIIFALASIVMLVVTAFVIKFVVRQMKNELKNGLKYFFKRTLVFIPFVIVPLVFSVVFCTQFVKYASWDYHMKKAPTSGEEYYDASEVYWLSRIIYAESGAEPFLGKIAVGNVVLNRVASAQFPDSIYGVIFDKKYGVQFSPVANGSIYKTPNSDSVIAAKICLEGYSVNNKVLYFMNPKLATNNWISQNRKYAFKIGTHYFYY